MKGDSLNPTHSKIWEKVLYPFPDTSGNTGRIRNITLTLQVWMNTYNSRFTLCNGNAMTWHSRYFSWCFCWQLCLSSHHSSSGAATHPNVSRTLCPGCWAAAVDLRIPQICHCTLRLRKDIMFVRLWFKDLGRQATIFSQNIPRYGLDEYTACKYFPYFFCTYVCHDLSTLPLWFDPISQVHGLEPPHWDTDPGGVTTWFPWWGFPTVPFYSMKLKEMMTMQ